jgi:hypothetical protein
MRRSDGKMLKTRRRKSWPRKQARSRSVGDGVYLPISDGTARRVGGIGRNGEWKEAKLANAGIGMD